MNRTQFIKKFRSQYDWLIKNNPSVLDEAFPKSSETNKEKIKNFFNKNKKFPSKTSKDKEEKSLYFRLVGYCSSSNNSYDKGFHSWAKSKGYGLDSSNINKQKIKDFFEKNKKFPSRCLKNKEERLLYRRLSSYCSVSHGCYDLEFHSWAKSKEYGLDTSSINKQKIKDFFNKNKMFPSRYSKNKEEKKLCSCLVNYCSHSNISYDSEFHSWAKNVGYGTLRNKKIICNETGVVYDSSIQASNILNINPSNISNVLRGKYKQTGGYSFKYVKDEEE